MLRHDFQTLRLGSAVMLRHGFQALHLGTAVMLRRGFQALRLGTAVILRRDFQALRLGHCSEAGFNPRVLVLRQWLGLALRLEFGLYFLITCP